MDMSEFKRWISYINAYGSGGKGKNVGFAKIESRNGRCRVQIRVKGVYRCDGRGLKVGFYARRQGYPLEIPAGWMRLEAGSGEFTAVTPEKDLFDSGYRLSDSGGLWLTGSDPEICYLSSWEDRAVEPWDFLDGHKSVKEDSDCKSSRADRPPSILYVTAAELAQEQKENGNLPEPTAEEISENIPESVKRSIFKTPAKTDFPDSAPDMTAKQPALTLDNLPQPGLWESLCRYYPKTAPELRERGVELLQIRPADLRYLPRQLWHFGSNSFLLHGYYHYRHLILGRMTDRKGIRYLLGVKGSRSERERFSAELFGFDSFLTAVRGSREGYWNTIITLDAEK